MQAHDSHAGLRTAGADPRTAKAGPRTADAGPRQLTQAYSSPRGTGYGFFTYGES